MFGAILILCGLYFIYKSYRYGRIGHFCSGSSGRMAQFKARGVQRLSKKLNLDSAQTQKLDAAADDFLAFKRAKHTGLATSEANLESKATPAWQNWLMGSTFDRQSASVALASRTEALQGKGEQLISSAANFFDSLNPEQQTLVRSKTQRTCWCAARAC